MSQKQHSAKDVERVAQKCFLILEENINEGRTAVNPESVMARAIKEAGLR